MHHALRLYSRYREKVLHFYMFWARWTRIPLIGRVVRRVANTYGKTMENAYLLNTEEACEIVDISTQLYLGPCTCREVFKNCDNPVNAEIMVGFHRNAFVDERPEDYRKIDADEAKSILRKCHELGLVHTIIKCRNDFFAICNCCTCCCVPLRLNRQYGIGHAVARDKDIVNMFSEQGKISTV
jgi:hypothetical protein